MLRKTDGVMHWLEFESLQDFPEVVHGIFLRQCGDFKAGFTERKQALSVLGVSDAVYACQEHGKKVRVVEEVVEMPVCDGLVTNQVKLALPILHADCQSALFYDPVNRVIANIHSGWRGNVQNIYAETVDVMQRHFQTAARNLIVCISPSLGPDRSEFKNFENELPKNFYPYQVKPTYFDLWEIAKMQLEKMGVKQIEIAEICTYENENDFFSYRRDRDARRNATFIALI